MSRGAESEPSVVTQGDVSSSVGFEAFGGRQANQVLKTAPLLFHIDKLLFAVLFILTISEKLLMHVFTILNTTNMTVDQSKIRFKCNINTFVF